MTPPDGGGSPEAVVLVAETADATRTWGERLGELLGAGDVLALAGELGAGKTTFAQGLARGLGVAPERPVASPTFALVHEYPGRVAFVHADLYRIEDAAELAELGLEEAFETAVVAVEWAERFPGVLPPDHLRIAIRADGGAGRLISLEPQGPRAGTLAAALAGWRP